MVILFLLSFIGASGQAATLAPLRHPFPTIDFTTGWASATKSERHNDRDNIQLSASDCLRYNGLAASLDAQ
jgi:hypothetical protein